MRSNEVANLMGVGMALVGIPNQIRRHPEVGTGALPLFSERFGVSGKHVRGEFRLNGFGGRPRRGEKPRGDRRVGLRKSTDANGRSGRVRL
jgi:hypothetical protein